MSEHAPDAQSPFWQELLIDTLRLAARVALKLGPVPLRDMKELVGVALYRELVDKGETHEAMSVTLACSLRTVKNLSKRSREADVRPADSSALARVIDRLQRGPATQRELSRLLPVSLEFDVARVAFGVLKASGLVEAQELGGRAGLALTEAWAHRDAVDWEAPLGEMDRLHRIGLSVFARLDTEAQTEAEIADAPRLNRLPRGMLRRVLAVMAEEGVVEAVGEGSWRLNGRVQRMGNQDPNTRWRQGLIYLMERLGLFIDFVLGRQQEEVVSQHSITFQARAEDLLPFYQELRAFVIERLGAIDDRAEARGGGQPCQIVWFASPNG